MNPVLSARKTSLLFILALTIVVACPVGAQQLNSPAASMVWNGVDSATPPNVVNLLGGNVTLAMGGAPNQGFLIVNAPAGLAAVSLPTALGSVDIDLTLGLGSLMNGTGIPFGAPSFLDPFAHTDAGGSANFSFSAGYPVTVNLSGMQAMVADPGSPVGNTLSAATSLSVNPSNTATTNYSLPDDGFVQHQLTIPVSYYGAVHNSLFMNSNGFVTFNAGSGDFTESMGEFFGGWGAGPNPGVAAYYSDLNNGGTASGASYDVIENGGTGAVKCEFTNQNHWSSSDPAGTFSVEFSGTVPGSVRFDMTGFIPALTATDDGIIGISDGDAGVGINTDLGIAPNTGWAGAIGAYVTPSGTGPDSIGQLFPGNLALGVTTWEAVQITPGEFAIIP